MRRWTLLLAGAGLWLFLAAIPALADGGPHVAANNSGVSTLTADGCAGCHRAHTAQGPMLLAAPDEEALCLSCHGTTGTGATTDVENGIQYTAAANGLRDTAVLGALRNGGFVTARINSSNPSRLSYTSGTSVRQTAKVGVLATGEAVTSAHLKLAGADGVTLTGTAWGNIAGTPGVTFDPASNPGTALALTCASCHNPHGNGQYRILNPIPATTVPGGFVAAGVGVTVTDAALPPADDTRNYTVIQTQGGTGTLLASQISASSNTAGDYFHRRVPWNGTATGTSSNDAPNGIAATFNGQINAWCSQCHSRYLAITGAPFEEDSGDAIFKYRHSNTSNKPCVTCHVAHGTNAKMPGTFSGTAAYPDGTTSASSRLLKIDNRGTCQACHDPTGTVPANTYLGPTPAPGAP